MVFPEMSFCLIVNGKSRIQTKITGRTMIIPITAKKYNKEKPIFLGSSRDGTGKCPSFSQHKAVNKYKTDIHNRGITEIPFLITFTILSDIFDQQLIARNVYKSEILHYIFLRKCITPIKPSAKKIIFDYAPLPIWKTLSKNRMSF